MRHRHRRPIGLSDRQMQWLMQAAKPMSVTVGQRHSFLLAIGQKLKLSGTDQIYPSDVWLQKVVADAVKEMTA